MIRFSTVSKTYPAEIGSRPHTALSRVSFSLARGRTLGLIGANGAGKSTSIKLLMDFIRPDDGKIEVMGKDPRDHRARRGIGYLPEVPAFPANLTALDLLAFVGATCGMPKDLMRDSSERWLTALGLWEARKRPLRSYSKGMQQRASFAAALLPDPELLILDEPMSGLDPIGRADIIALIRRLRDEGRTILFCSHILEDVDRLADEVLILHKGRALFHGTTRDLNRDLGGASLVDGFLRLVKGMVGEMAEGEET